MKEYISNDRKCNIIFDDYNDERKEYGSWWVGMCEKCFCKYKAYVEPKSDNCGSGCCSVLGCNNEAEYYIDFKAEELKDVMKLMYKGTDREVKYGDVLTTSRGEIYKAYYWREPNHGEGKVTVKNEKGECREFYVSVFGLEWI